MSDNDNLENFSKISDLRPPFDLNYLVRENIKKLTPYSSARHEFTGKASVLLDANENPYGSPLQDSFKVQAIKVNDVVSPSIKCQYSSVVR
jgi:hypothetical protein